MYVYDVLMMILRDSPIEAFAMSINIVKQVQNIFIVIDLLLVVLRTQCHLLAGRLRLELDGALRSRDMLA